MPLDVAQMSPDPLTDLSVNTLRFLSVDAIQKANSGHPGLPMGAAPMAYALWTRFLKHSPANPHWFDRDRFVLSAGHGSALLYSLLHLTGYDVPMEQVQQFRQKGSITAGHPERGLAPGVEVTTGPLGQGFANAVGMAAAEAHLAARFNRPGHEIICHTTYALAGDGDLMEGISYEAASLAGHWKLGRLIVLYDDNRVTLAAGTDMTFSEDRARRFEAMGWHCQSVEDGNDVEAVTHALRVAQEETERPSLILVRTHIGFGSPHKQDSFEAHGSPLGAEEVRLAKEKLGWPTEPAFLVPPAVRDQFRQALVVGARAESDWNARFERYAESFPKLAGELQRMIRGELPAGWDAALPTFPPDAKGLATRAASGKVMNALAASVPELIGGSADLDPSTQTALKGLGDFQPASRAGGDTQGSTGGGWSMAGRNLHFGIREHAMGGILNGIAAHGGLIPFGATFLVFSDYMRPSIRLAALMGLHAVYVFTHDSLAVGEDGPTHEPVEQIAALRAIPNLLVIRPSDANETSEAWRVAVAQSDRPVALVLTRQAVPTLDRGTLAPAIGLRRGAYVLADEASGRADCILIATGSEVSLALAARGKLLEQGIRARVVAMPSWELFDAQPREYRESVLPPGAAVRVAVEAGSPFGWHRYVGDRGDVIGVERFGASMPGDVLMREVGFTVENVVASVRALLAKAGK